MVSCTGLHALMAPAHPQCVIVGHAHLVGEHKEIGASSHALSCVTEHLRLLDTHSKAFQCMMIYLRQPVLNRNCATGCTHAHLVATTDCRAKLQPAQ